jgi:6-pyruvoyltetrahydropterin/6-carboxytetrahydropterin synthase
MKTILEDTFDHTLVVAEDDPEIGILKELHRRGIARVVVLPNAGCEKFAEYIYDVCGQWLHDAGFGPRCRLVSVEVSEHGANSAIFTGR